MCMCAVAADTMIQYGNYCKVAWTGNGIINTGKTHRLPFFLFVSNRRYARNAPADPRPRGRQSRTTVGLNDRTNRSDRPTGPTDRPSNRWTDTSQRGPLVEYCITVYSQTPLPRRPTAPLRPAATDAVREDMYETLTDRTRVYIVCACTRINDVYTASNENGMIVRKKTTQIWDE